MQVMTFSVNLTFSKAFCIHLQLSNNLKNFLDKYALVIAHYFKFWVVWQQL